MRFLVLVDPSTGCQLSALRQCLVHRKRAGVDLVMSKSKKCDTPQSGR